MSTCILGVWPTPTAFGLILFNPNHAFAKRNDWVENTDYFAKERTPPNPPHEALLTICKRNWFFTLMKRFSKGAFATAYSGELAKRDLLKRNKEDLDRSVRRKLSNKVVQKGGVITVGAARKKIEKRELDAVEAAEKVLAKAVAAEAKKWKAAVKS